MVWLHVTIIRNDGFELFKQSVIGIKVEQVEAIVNITLTYDNKYDETISVKKNELKTILTNLQMHGE
jgi:hypothetical protein